MRRNTARTRGTASFIGTEDIDATLWEAARLAQQSQIPVLLVGGIAMRLYGSDRMTTDVDVASTGLPVGVRPTRLLTFGGATILVGPKKVPLDWIVRDDAYEKVFDAAINHPISVAGIPIPVVRPEYLVLMKMIANRPKDELDLMVLLNSGRVPRKRAAKLARELMGEYAGDVFESLVREADWIKSRE